MSRKLTREQMAAIMMAHKAGLSKRELFESDVASSRFNKLPREQRERIIHETAQGKPFPPELSVFRANSNTKGRDAIDKALAINELNKNKQAKEAFIKDPSLRFQDFRAKELR